jgi:hypothetical protein
MKNKLISLIILLFVILFAGCEFDNYDPPTSTITGNVVYNGGNVNVRSGGTELELWQYGYALRQKIPVYIAQDGTFSAKVFDGDYKLVRLNGGPWQNQSDSIDVSINGTATIDVPVIPYFTISNASISYNNITGVVTATCNVTKVGTLNIDNLTLYVGVTNIIDPTNSSQNFALNAAALSDLTTAKTLTVTLNETNKARSNIFVRIGVKAAGIGERLYTPVEKVILQTTK